MDALSRLAPVARPLLRQVDDVLASLGAPAEHEVWRLLRRVGATPADAVTGLVELNARGPGPAGGNDAAALGQAAAAARAEADRCRRVVIPAQVPWTGGAGDTYAATSAGLDAYVRQELAGRLDATASYVDEVAGWQERSRDLVARALAAVLGCAQAVTLRSAVGGSAEQVGAAADIGAHVLTAVAWVLDRGHELLGGPDTLAEVRFRAAAHTGPARFDATIRLRH